MNNPEFSAVISAYNKDEFIGKTIESVLKQTCQDFELIVIDDGSTDNTRNIVCAYTDARIRYFHQPHSGLPAVSRNKSMSFSRGKYIAFLDGDDIWVKNKLEKCHKALEESPDAKLVCHNEAIMHGGRILRRTSYGPYVTDMYKKLILEGNCLHPSAVAIHRDVYFRDGFRFSEEKKLFAIEDYEFWIRLSKAYPFLYIPDVLAYYRVNDKGIFLEYTESNTLNMLSLLDAHFAKLDPRDRCIQKKIRRRRSSVMSGAGRMYHHRKIFKDSRKWYARAIREDPLNFKPYIGFLAALLGIRIIYR